MRRQLTLDEVKQLCPDCRCIEYPTKFFIKDTTEQGSGLTFAIDKEFELNGDGEPIDPIADWLNLNCDTNYFWNRFNHVIFGNFFDYRQFHGEPTFYISSPQQAKQVLLLTYGSKVELESNIRHFDTWVQGGLLYIRSRPSDNIVYPQYLTTYYVADFTSEIWKEEYSYILHPKESMIIRKYEERSIQRDYSYHAKLQLLEKSRNSRHIYEPRLRSLSERLIFAIATANLDIDGMQFYEDHFTYPDEYDMTRQRRGYYTVEGAHQAEKTVNYVINTVFNTYEIANTIDVLINTPDLQCRQPDNYIHVHS